MEKKNISRTYLAIDADSKIIGYYSIGLRCLKVPKKEDENGNELKDDRFTIRMNVDPKTRVAQSYLIGQLSRSWDSPKGFGSKLMENAIHHSISLWFEAIITVLKELMRKNYVNYIFCVI